MKIKKKQKRTDHRVHKKTTPAIYDGNEFIQR